MAKVTQKIDDKFVRAAPSPDRGNKVHYDTEIKGFGLRVTAAGAKAFVLNYYAKGHEHRITIGKYPDWSVAAAREEAKKLKRDTDRGIDPLAKRIEERDAPTVSDLWEKYQLAHLPHKRQRSGKDDRSMWLTYILPKFKNVKLADLTKLDVGAFHLEIGRTKPVRANRVLEVFRHALNLAKEWKWIDDNPAVGVKKFAEHERLRHLSPTEIRHLAAAFDAHPRQDSVNAIRLLLLTGARKMEVLGARWDHLLFEEGIWKKPPSTTKQNKEHRIPLSQAASALFASIRDAEGSDPVFVFPGDGASGHMVDVKRTWQGLKDMATMGVWSETPAVQSLIAEMTGKLDRKPTVKEVEKEAEAKGVRLPVALRDVHMHDLRHTYASLLVSANISLPIIGALLGHASQQSTKRYAHLHPDPLKDATELVAATVERK